MIQNKKKLLLMVGIIIAGFFYIIYMDNKNSPESDKDLVDTSIHVAETGAKGDGENDDTKAIQKAVDSLKNKTGTVIFESGKTYLITDSIKSDSNITFRSTENEKATIFMDNNENKLPAFDLKGTLKYTTTIQSDQLNIGDRSIALKTIDDIQSGDLLLIESDTPWYFDPRTDKENLHKGELHRVIGVNEQNVLLENQIWDKYNKSAEEITVKIIKPIKVNVQNIEVERTKSNNRTVGIKLEFTNDSVIDNVTIKNSVSTGIHVVSSFRTNIENSVILGANDQYSGYGIQTYGSSFSMIRNNTIYGSRRGIDISGLYPDYHSIVEYNNVFGGGKNENGLLYLTEDTQYGIGTHSTANYTIFRNNTIGNLNYGVNIRSANVTIENNTFVGYFKGAGILLTFGKNAYIKNNKTISGNIITQSSEQFSLPENIDTFEANSFIYIKDTYSLANGTLKIANNQTDNLLKQFILVYVQNKSFDFKLENIFLEKNLVKYNIIDSNNPVYFINSTEMIYKDDISINKNILRFNKQKGQYKLFNNIISSGS